MYLTPAYRLMRNAEKKRILERKTDSRLRIDDDENEMMKGYREVAFMRRWAVGGQLALASALAEGRCRLLVEERSFCRVVMCKRRVGSVFVARKYRQVGIRCLDRVMSVNCHLGCLVILNLPLNGSISIGLPAMASCSIDG